MIGAINGKDFKNIPMPGIFIRNEVFLIAAAFALSFLNQKPIKKYEHKPTPSQPKNNCKKLSDVTKVNIENVNSER